MVVVRDTSMPINIVDGLVECIARLTPSPRKRSALNGRRDNDNRKRNGQVSLFFFFRVIINFLRRNNDKLKGGEKRNVAFDGNVIPFHSMVMGMDVGVIAGEMGSARSYVRRGGGWVLV